MKPAFRHCLAGLGFLAIPAAARAAGITYDCDTAANHYSELSLPAGGAPFTVSGTVQLNAIAASKTYAPMARIQIASPAAPGQSPGAFAGFSLTALPGDAKKTPSGAALQMLSYMSSGTKEEVVPLSTMTKPGTPQPFSLTYDGSKVVVALAGAETKSLALTAADPVVRIVCSTGEFLFTDVTIAPAR
jgi:hypothetical protein